MLTNMLLHKYQPAEPLVTHHHHLHHYYNSSDLFYSFQATTTTTSPFYIGGGSPEDFGSSSSSAFGFGAMLQESPPRGSPDSEETGEPAVLVGRLRIPPPPPKFKLCEVCGHGGATSHYGGTVCGGCKIFFSRTVQSRKGFVCERGGQCPMNAGKRAKCRACRFQLCLKAHMSPEEVGRLRDMRLGDYGPLVKKEGTVVGYFDENSQPTTSLQDSANQYRSFLDVFNFGEISVLAIFVNLERSCENNAAVKYANLFPRRVNASMEMSNAIDFPIPICERIPMDYMRREFLEDPRNNMKLFWCRNVLHFLEWASANEDLGQFSRQEKTLLVAENFLPIACLTSFYGFLKIQREQFEASPPETGTVPAPCSMEWFSAFSKLSSEAQTYVHRAISEIMEPMDSLDISMEEMVLLKFIMLFNESSSTRASHDMYRIRGYRLKYFELLRKHVMDQVPDPEKRIARISELLKIVESVRNTSAYLDKWMTMFYTSNTCEMNDVLVYDFHVRTYHEFFSTSSSPNFGAPTTSSGASGSMMMMREIKKEI